VKCSARTWDDYKRLLRLHILAIGPWPRLEESLGAAELELTAHDIHTIETAIAAVPVKGARYSEQHQKLVNR
jgi:hypothetical protein